MANMSYCRFENTANDVQDCLKVLYDLDSDSVKEFYDNLSSDYERAGFKNFLRLCEEVAAYTDEMLSALDN